MKTKLLEKIKNDLYYWVKISIIFLIVFFIVIFFAFFGTKSVFTFLMILLFSMIIIEFIFQLNLDNIIEKIISKSQQLSLTDIINNKEYYRNIIKEYSIGELYYIDKMEQDSRFTAVITLLMLINKKIIKIENKKIVIVNKSNAKLKKSEKYLLDAIKDGKLNIRDLTNVSISESKIKIKSLDSVIYEECKEDKLVYIGKNRIKCVLLPITITTIVTCVLWLAIFNEYLNSMNSLAFIIPIIIILINILIFKHVIILPENLCKRTPKGNEINNYLNGLKHFINDFGNIDDKTMQSIKLWDDYLIYSVMFKNNKKVLDEIDEVIIDADEY